MAPRRPAPTAKSVEAITHADDKRKNIPSAEAEPLIPDAQRKPQVVPYQRNIDLDPQLVWRGKDAQDERDLIVTAPPIYIQENIAPKALVADLMRRSQEAKPSGPDLFAEFGRVPEGADRTDFYRHEQNWSNRMILGDSLQVMASLAEKEGLRGKVQCIYFDPPYGIKFNSNFQWSTTSRDVKDGNAAHITREPEQVKAFRDTWRDGIHSYLTYLRDRLTVARDLLAETGSIFVQIGDENVHRVRAVMDEVFSAENFISLITVQTTTGFKTNYIGNIADFVLWYAKDKPSGKARSPLGRKTFEIGEGNAKWLMLEDFSYRGVTASEKRGEVSIPEGAQPYVPDNLISQGQAKEPQPFQFRGKIYDSWGKRSHWKASHPVGMTRLAKANRIHLAEDSIRYVRFHSDFEVSPLGSIWTDTSSGNFTAEKIYVVQTNAKVVERCLLMATDPGDLVLDPTCGSGTTATVAEQWGRRWITIDTSRVALALARARVMGARYPYYLLTDSPEGRRKEADVTRSPQSNAATFGNIRHGFVYERVPHVTLKSIANNAEIDVIWDKWQATLEPTRQMLNAALGKSWEEWQVPREAEAKWSEPAKKLHGDWWRDRIARQREIDASIAAKAEFEYLYDRPYEDKKRVRVAGPFTVESLSPHRMLGVDEHDELIDPHRLHEHQPFDQMVLENLRTAGVQQIHKERRIQFERLEPCVGHYICAEGCYPEGNNPEYRAAIFIGPEFGTVQRADLVAAAREAADAGFDALIACAFNFEAHSTEFSKLGKLPILKARMNADLHMSAELKSTKKANLFVVFGEPDIDLLTDADGRLRVKINGVDVFHPMTGRVESSNADGIACWFLDTDYNEESFFVRHAYFLGAGDPYTALKTTLKAEIDPDAWASLNSDTSRPFDKPKGGRIAVKVINHLGDEVMKVFRVS